MFYLSKFRRYVRLLLGVVRYKELMKSKHSSQQDENEEIIVRNKDVALFMLRVRMNDKTLSPADRREARRELLLKMGAKPPKGPVINYRVLQENKRLEKEDRNIDFRGEKSKQKILERMSGFGLLDKHYRRQAERQERRGKETVKIGKNKLPKRFAWRFNKNRRTRK
nr:expressed conserved protein [Hymenolepis microstoma]